MDEVNKLAADITASVIETCANIAKIYRIRRCENDYQRGYNAAVDEIAEKISKLNCKVTAS